MKRNEVEQTPVQVKHMPTHANSDGVRVATDVDDGRVWIIGETANGLRCSWGLDRDTALTLAARIIGAALSLRAEVKTYHRRTESYELSHPWRWRAEVRDGGLWLCSDHPRIAIPLALSCTMPGELVVDGLNDLFANVLAAPPSLTDEALAEWKDAE